MELEIKTGTIRQLAADISNNANGLKAARTAVANVRRNCAIWSSSRQSILNSLQSIEKNLQKEEASVKKLGSSLWDIVSLYKETENNIVGAVGKNGTANTPENGAADSGAGENDTDVANTASRIWKWSDTWNMISSFGVPGGFAAAIGNLVTGEMDAGTVLSSAKFLSKTIGTAATACTKGDTTASWWKYFNGMNDATADFAGSSFGETFFSSLKKQFTKDLNFGNATEVGDKVKVATKWAGHALTVAKNGVENFQEYKNGDISAGRAVAETAVESAVDIGMGALATAGVTAAAVAMGVAAPAVAVGIGAVAVTWAANGVCKWATGGKDVGEVVADSVCNVGEAAVSVAKSGVKTVSDGAKTVAKGVGEAVNSVGNLMTSISTKWSNGIFAFT